MSARRWLAPFAALLVVLVAVLDTRAALRGVFAAFLVALAVPAGAMLLLLIHRLTGGRWGEAIRPPLARAASLVPAAALLALPAVLLPAAVFPWAADPALVRHPDVAGWYLNGPSFALRSATALLLWGGLGLLAARRPERLTPPLAAVGLALFGLTVSFAAVDWVVSLDPAFKSSAFAMSLAVAFLVSGLGYATAASPDMEAEARADAAKLMAAFALGLVYLDLMQFIVAYAGNLPEKAAWYARRETPVAIAALALAFLLAALVPIAAAMRGDWRASAAVQRRVGAGAVLGVALRTLWWTVPELGGAPLFWLAFALAGAAALGAAAALGHRSDTPPLGFRRRLPHGA